LDTLQAAILQVKLRHLDSWNDKRQQVANTYGELLSSLPGVKLPQALPGGKSVWNQYTIAIEDKQSSDEPTRDTVRQQLQQMGVSSMVYYPIPLHLQPVYQNLGYQQGQLSQVEQIARQVLSLPMFPDLSFEEQQQVAYCLKDCLL
jgi:dTDP-4-amino-4,6-dideoxygalactose transaminase